MKPLRIAYVIESLGRGGAERQLINLLTALDRKQFQPIVLFLDPRYDFAPDLEALNIGYLCLNVSKYATLPIAVARLVTLFKQLKIDLVHTWLLRADLVGRTAAWLRRLPVISSVQAPIYQPHVLLDNVLQKSWKLQIVRGLDWLTGKIAQTYYVGCSMDTSVSVGRALRIHPSKSRTIYNSVVVPQQQIANSHAPRLITIGRLAAQKGQRYLIEAMAEIRKYIPAISLSIVGDGSLHNSLQQLAYDHQVDDCIHFLGVRQDIDQLLADHTLFVFPSLWEGFGLAIVEAMAVGIPVIASDIPVFHEIIDDGVQGLLVPPQNAQALSQAIIELLNDPEHCKSMGEAGRQRVAERFDIQITIRQWESLYKQLG